MISADARNRLGLFGVKGNVTGIIGASGSYGHACAVAVAALPSDFSTGHVFYVGGGFTAS